MCYVLPRWATVPAELKQYTAFSDESMCQTYPNIISVDKKYSKKSFRSRFVLQKRNKIKNESKKSELGVSMFLYHLNVTETVKSDIYKFYDIKKTALVIIDFYNLSEYRH